MNQTKDSGFRNRAVGEVVTEDYRRGAVFKRYGIDFCCGGGQTVQAACDRAGVSYEDVERALIAADERGNGVSAPDPRGWDLDFLADYIVNVHHGYVRENLPVLLQFSSKVARVHGGARPELIETANVVEELAGEMQQHMMKEEQVLFPYIRQLAAARRSGGSVQAPAFGTAQHPIRVMEHEHDHAGGLMRQLRSLTSDYVPPQGACNTYRALFAKLEEFEEDLHRHVHLENNLLFPATTELEQELSAAA